MKRFIFALIILGMLAGCEVPPQLSDAQKKTVERNICLVWGGQDCN